MNKLGILLDDRYFDHQIEAASPENPNRLRELFPAVRKRYNGNLRTITPHEADTETIEKVHSNFYLSQIREHALKSNPFSYDQDTYLMQQSLATAQLAAGGCLEIADQIMEGEIDHGFALIRPPGHHAEPGRGMGFCILNNIAITAKYLQTRYHLSRILIIDFDVHHGNGTQEVFYDTDQVLFVSIHQKNLFPFSGAPEEIGNEQGRGYNINIPVHSQFGDAEYTYLLGKTLQGLAIQFMPQIILVSAGYDGHAEESISATTMLKQAAKEICDNRLLFVLEGGYNPLSLEKSVLKTIDSMLEPETKRVGVLHSARAAQLLTNHPLQDFWTL